MEDHDEIVATAITELSTDVQIPDPALIRAAAAKRTRNRSLAARGVVLVTCFGAVILAAVLLLGGGAAEVATDAQQEDEVAVATTQGPNVEDVEDAPLTTLIPETIDVTPAETLEPAIPPVSSESPPANFLFVRDGVEIVEVIDGAERVVAGIESNVEAPSFIESILPIDQDLAVIGVCCEPALGNQVLVDLETGETASLELLSSFPAVDPSRNTLVVTDMQVRAVELDPLLLGAGDDGVIRIFDEAGGGNIIERSAFVGEDRLVVTNGETLELFSRSGDDVLQNPDLSGVRSVAYDARNRLIVAIRESSGVLDPTQIAADELVILHPETLEVLEQQPLSTPAREIDVRDGWVLLTQANGQVIVRDINAVETQTTIASGASVAEWSLSENTLEIPPLSETAQ